MYKYKWEMRDKEGEIFGYTEGGSGGRGQRLMATRLKRFWGKTRYETFREKGRYYTDLPTKV